MVGLLNQYTESLKEFIPSGQEQSLWEQFLTGTQSTYESLAEQTRDIHSYDISEAYANYKKQQLQLKMNERLGEGFVQKIGSELQTQYNRAYQDIRTQETSALSQVLAQQQETIAEGSEEFEKLGSIAKNYDRALQEYANLTGVSEYEGMTTTRFDEQGNRVTELTDYGRLWYQDVLNKEYTDPLTGNKIFFEDWLETEDSDSEISYKDRLALSKALKQNPELFANIVTGLTEDFDYEKTKQERQAAIEEKTRVEQADAIASKFSSEDSLHKSISGGRGTKESNNEISSSLRTFTEEYAPGSIVEVDSWYDNQRQKQESAVDIRYDSLTPAQQNALRQVMGHDNPSNKDYIDLTNKNGIITIYLDTKEHKKGQTISYTSFINALRK